MMRWLGVVCFVVVLGSVVSKEEREKREQTFFCDVTEGHNVTLSESLFGDRIDDVFWSSYNNQVIWVRSSSGVLSVSRDSGQKWDEDGTEGCLQDVTFFSEGARGKVMYAVTSTNVRATRDNGKTFLENPGNFPGLLGGRPTMLHPHPSESDWASVIVMAPACVSPSSPECVSNLFVTKDAGVSWTLIYEQVSHCSWAGAGLGEIPAETLIFLAKANSSQVVRRGSDLLRLESLSEPIQPNPILSSVDDFIFRNGILHIFCFHKSDPNLLMYESHDSGASFMLAQFPGQLTPLTYSVVDASENETMIQVIESENAGTLFASGWEKEGHLSLNEQLKENKYSVLAQNILFETQESSLYRVLSLPGTFVANFKTGLSEIQTKVSHEMGSIWSHIPPPKDSDECIEGTQCHLHLFGPAFESSGFAPILSQERAVGLILANGHVAPILNSSISPEDVGVYFSRDSGNTFTTIAKRPHAYAMGDSGSLILLAQNYLPTRELLFSWDQGSTFSSCTFTSKGEIKIDRIISQPGDFGFYFLLIGSRVQDGHEFGVVIQADYSKYHERKCISPQNADSEHSDYEQYYPTDLEGDPCLLGSTYAFVRRKQNRSCYSAEYNVEPLGRPCPCTREDYMCDFCFVPDMEGNCVRSYEGNCEKYDHTAPPIFCKGSYSVSTGYRKVPNNICVPGGLDIFDKDPEIQMCPAKTPPPTKEPKKKSNNGWIYTLIFIFVVVGVVIFVLYKVKPIRACLISRTLQFMRRNDDDDDELFGSSYRNVGVVDAVSLLDSDEESGNRSGGERDNDEEKDNFLFGEPEETEENHINFQTTGTTLEEDDSEDPLDFLG
mmetsp:Transcript_16268/g.22542  ORF Transcript_16268/g.22542 Transcript_16268/m.22542 type:complete len:835 (+) Transcript_16268:693-3197(+)